MAGTNLRVRSTGKTCATGVVFPVPDFPTGMQNMAWQTSFSTDSSTVTLTPSASSGTKETAKIVVNDNTNNSPQTVFLKGTVQ